MAQHVDIDIGSVTDPNAAIPEGTYTVVCRDSNIETSKGGDQMVRLQFAVQGGEHAGHNLFHYAMLEGDGARFGQFFLQCMFQAIGSDDPDIDLLVGESFDVQVAIQPGDEEYPDDRNRITKVFTGA